MKNINKVLYLNCDYYILQDIYESMDAKLDLIASNLSDSEFKLKIDALDVDLDNIEQQLIIANKLQLLDAVGTDIMTEAEQKSAYQSLKNELFTSNAGAGSGSTSGDGADLDG